MITRFGLALFAGCTLAASAFAADGTHPHWTYEGAEGPESWGTLSPDFTACADGAMQSPIDLSATNAEGAVTISTSYAPVPLTVLNNGHTVQMNAGDAGTLVSGGVEYKLLQVHFHTPSEHVIDGKHAPLEAHFVHQSDDGRLAVLGVMIVEGAENPTLTELFRHLPTKEAEAVTYDDVTIDFNGLLPADKTIFRYMGSLTTPPCSEGVNWHLLAKPVEASDRQIGGLEAVMGENNRPVQPLGNRLLVGPAEKTGL